MRHQFKTLLSSAAVALTLIGFSPPTPARAQTYPIDCAILLCLSGGWPASDPCTRARAEFIRRITPWPVEPPLQIWRCPMAVSFGTFPSSSSANRVFEVLFRVTRAGPRQSFPHRDASEMAKPIEAAWRHLVTSEQRVHAERTLWLVKDRADIDISGREFDFVRSIRVFDIRYARQHESRYDGDCNRSATVVLGTYGTQGDFAWQRSTITALPAAHVGLERWGESCPRIYHRSIFVDWRDNGGAYGFEQVNY